MIEISKEAYTSLSEQYRLGVEDARSIVPDRGSEYWKKWFYISKEGSGASTGTPDDRAYQIGPLDLAASEEVGNLVVVKPVRFGWSKITANTLARQADQIKKSAKVWNSRAEDSNKYVRREIDPMLRDQPRLKTLMPRTGLKTSDDRLNEKKFFGYSWFFDGAHSPDNFKADSLSLAIGDEVSTWPHLLTDSGSAIDLIKGRLIEDPMSRMILGSTPRKLPDCLISKTYEEMEIRLKFHTPCVHCGHLQVIEMKEGEDSGIVFDIKKTYSKSAETVRCVCESCGDEFGFVDAQEMQPQGFWMDEDGEHYHNPVDGLMYDSSGPMDAWKLKIGMQANILIVPSFPWTEYIYDYQRVQAAFEAGNVGPAQTFQNEKNGLGWDDQEGIQRISYGVLHDRAIDYPSDGTIPDRINYITSWFDVQGDRLEGFTVGWYKGEEDAAESGYLLDYKIITGNPIESSRPWEELDWYFKKEFIRETGEPLEIGIGGIDRGWELSIDKVERFCRSFEVRGKIIPTVGTEGIGKSLIKYPLKPNKPDGKGRGGVYLTTISTNTGKAWIYRMLNIADRDSAGSITFPKQQPENNRYMEFGENFYRGVVAGVPKRIKRGNRSIVVFESASRRDEPQDGLVGNLALVKIAQQYRGIDLREKANIKKKMKYDLASIGKELR